MSIIRQKNVLFCVAYSKFSEATFARNRLKFKSLLIKNITLNKKRVK